MFSAATVAVGVLIFLILSSQVAMATFPVVGIGGLFLTADTFDGEDAIVYPEKGTIDESRGVVTDTMACQERPMLVFDLQGAEATNYALYKDIRVPYFQDEWVTIQIVEENGGVIDASNIQLYTTQLEADTLDVDNIRLAEGGPGAGRSDEKFGPNSGEFILQGDPLGQTPDGDNNLRTTNVKAWLHAILGQQLVLQGGADGFVDIELRYLTTSDIQNRYDSIGIDSLDRQGRSREGYFDCLPGS